MIDPILIEVVRNKLDDIADEMEITLLKSSHSPIVKEALDASAALFDVHAQQVAQATAAPIHLGMIIPAMQRFVEVFPPQMMKEGDVYVLNDPYDGGTHLPDIVMSVPVIVHGSPIMMATAISHHQEIGGRSAGSTPTDAVEIFQEGFRIPPLKLYDAGEPNHTLISLLTRNVRIPETVMGDLRGQLAACETGRRRILEVADRLGSATLERLIAELLDRAESLTRESIARIPDGTYRFTDYLDNDGIDLDRRVRISASVTIRGSEISVDLTGSDPQVQGPINCVPASTLSTIYYVVRAITDASIPNNAGCYRPVHVILPEGSVVNAHAPAAVNGRAVVVRRIVDCLLGALIQAMPLSVPAASGGHPLFLTMGGVDDRVYVTSEPFTGGMGARPSKDGIDAIQTDTSNSQNVPVEALEIDYPIRVGHYRLRPDSGGPGKWRGGLGLCKQFELLKGRLHVSHRGERHFTAPWGVFGGEAGTSASSMVTRVDGSQFQVPSKMEFDLLPGDKLDVLTTGGGGYGDPLERDPQRVLEDVIDGKVTFEQARSRYGVAILEGQVASAGWEDLRSQLRATRGAVTWTFDRGPLGKE